MQAVILAAGLGTRMGELTKVIPKPLLTIENKTLLHHSLEALPEEIDKVILVVGYLADLIKAEIGNVYKGKQIKYIEQKELSGTAHALMQCKGRVTGKFLVIMGDDLYAKKDLKELIGHPLSILVRTITADIENDFNAKIELNPDGTLKDIVERQKIAAGDLANCGAYVLDERFFDLPLVAAGNKSSEYGLPQTMLGLIKKGARMDIVRATWWHKVTSPEDLELAKKNIV